MGSALVLAAEWAQVFETRDLALRAPETLRMLDARRGPTLSDLGAMIALGTFVIGWIALAVFSVRTNILPRWAAGLVIAGFLSTPLLQMALPGLWGSILGNAILGSGWAWLGNSLRASATLVPARGQTALY